MNKALFFICFTFFCHALFAQRVGVYTFEYTLRESTNKFPELRVLGHRGEFRDEVIPELDKVKRKVYVFDKNCGFQINNREANGFFDGSFTIEMYFKFEDLSSWKRVVDFKNRKSDNGCYIYDGKLNFYNFALGEKAPVRAGEYTHYVMSRDEKTKQVKMYVDGLSKVDFIDKTNESLLDEDGVLNFFYDDLIVKDEASEGAIALLKIYDYVVTPIEIKDSYKKLAVQFNAPTLATNLKNDTKVSATTNNNPPQNKSTPKPPAEEKKVVVDLTKPYQITSSVQNSNNKQPIEAGTVMVLDSDMVEVQKVPIQKGSFEFTVKPNQEYNLIVEAQGFLPTGVHLSPKQMPKLLSSKMVLSMEAAEVGKAVIMNDLYFVQSKAELLPESKLEVTKLIEFMKNNAKAEIELHGHTDNQGDFDLNVQLSKQRVETIKGLLVKSGIDARRINGRGFGATRPIASNGREETRKMNRRVEFVITKL